jgi:hypothetical protein
MIGRDITNARVLRRRKVTLERLAAWIGVAGAVALQSAMLLLCYRAIGDELGVGSFVLPAGIAISGLAMIGGSRLAARRSRSAFALRLRLRLVGENDSELGGETQRSAA